MAGYLEADGRFNSEFQGSSPRSSLSRARFGRRSAGRAHLAPGLGAGVAGASGNLGDWQARRAHLPWTCLPCAAATPGCGAPEPDRYAGSPSAPKGRGRPSPPQRPGQAICRLPSPTLAPLSGPGMPGHPRPEPKLAAEAGRFAPRSYLVQRPGKPRAPRPQSSGPGFPGAGSSGKREGGPGSVGGRGGAGGLGAPAGWEDGAHSQSWTRDCSESGRRIPSSSRRPGEARGGGVRGDGDLIVT